MCRIPKCCYKIIYVCFFLYAATLDHKYGMHGYDNNLRNMHPYFLAFGPSIRQGIEVPPFNSVDLYSLWAHMLNIPEFQAPSNGSFKVSSAAYILKDDSFDVPSVLTCKYEVQRCHSIDFILIQITSNSWE
jgi:hypothetical protein